ncbi:MAG: T9SS type A sorting domain-containing protein [Bacteroidia bacterium]
MKRILTKSCIGILLICLLTIPNTLFGQSLVIDSLWGNNGIVQISSNARNCAINSYLEPATGLNDLQIKHYGMMAGFSLDFITIQKMQYYTSAKCLDSASVLINQASPSNGGLLDHYLDMYVGYESSDLDPYFYNPVIKKEMVNGEFDEEFELNFHSNFDTPSFGTMTSICSANSSNTFLATGYEVVEHPNFIARYTLNGLIDSTYGSYGYVSIDDVLEGYLVNPQNNYLLGLDDGGSILTGYCRDTSAGLNYYFAVNLDTNGDVITNSNSENQFLHQVDLSRSAQTKSVLQYNNGFISLISNSEDNSSLIKLTYEGLLDSTFGDNGVVNLIGLPYSLINSSYLYSHTDETFFLISNSLDFEENGKVTLFSVDGEIVSSFGENGEAEINIPGYVSRLNSIIPISETEFITIVHAKEISSFNEYLFSVKFILDSQASSFLIQDANTFISFAPNAVSYQWYMNGVEINGAVDSSFTFTSNGVYSVRVIDIHGCENTIGSIEITSAGIIEQLTKEEFSVNPNPSNGEFSISSNTPNASFNIYNSVGQCVLSGASSNSLLKLKDSGVYTIVSDKGYSKKILVQ